MNGSTRMFSNADMVFRNEMLIGKILNNLDIEKETFKHLNLRLVSKEFNTEMLKFIGKDCQHIEFDLTFDWDLYETVTRINGQLIPRNGVEQCIQFLRNVVNVDIKSVHFLGDSDFSNTAKLHEFFMETLVLTNENPVRILTADQVEICSSNEKRTICLPCRVAAPVCKEYGPMTLDVLLHSFETPHHFTTLKITDFLLQLIAIKCTKESKTREECVEMLKGIITPNISCDNLFIPIFVMDWNMGNIPHAQPREVFTEIFQKWKPKNLTLRFIKNRYKNVSRPWRRPADRLLTDFSFGMDPSKMENMDNSSVEHVVVDAKWSEMEHRNKEYWQEPYLFLFSNLMRAFPKCEDILVIRKLKNDVAFMFEEILSKILEHAWDECSEETTTKLFIRFKYTSFVLHPETEIDVPNVSGDHINGFRLLPAEREVKEKFENWKNVLNDFEASDIREAFTLKSPKQELHFELVHTKETLELARNNASTPFQTMFYYNLFGRL